MKDYDRIADIIHYLDDHHTGQPDLSELAAHVNLSNHHFHRLFARWAGITPHQFLGSLTHSHARQLLQAGKSVLATTLETGLSSPGRLHDLCVKLEAASPGEIKSGGAGWEITASFAESPLGTCLVGKSPRGICHFSFVDNCNKQQAESLIHEDWPNAEIAWEKTAGEQIVKQLFTNQHTQKCTAEIPVIVAGTRFQVRVWKALLKVPKGTLISYGQLARAIGQPKAARAVGSAIANNSIAYLIPCHRVIRETGVLGNYRWGTTRKTALHAWEQSQQIITDH